jgi:hypothetical protein
METSTEDYPLGSLSLACIVSLTGLPSSLYCPCTYRGRERGKVPLPSSVASFAIDHLPGRGPLLL